MLIATEDQLYAAKPGQEPFSPTVRLDGETVHCIASSGEITAACYGEGVVSIFTNGDSRRLEFEIEESIECLAIVAEDPLHLVVGTEPAHLYRLVEGDRPARFKAFDQLDCRENWYTPWDGPPAVRTVASIGSWMYADIHVGNIMRSSDQGNHWEPVTPDLHDDVHQVAVCPAAPERLYANTANAVYISPDRGVTWEHRAAGMLMRYGRAIAVHPKDPDNLLASVSEGPGEEAAGQLFYSPDGGLSWTHVTNGFPQVTVGNIDTFHLTYAEDAAWAVVDVTLYKSVDSGRTWETVWNAPSPIRAIA